MKLCKGRQRIGIKKLHYTDCPINSDGHTHTHACSVSFSLLKDEGTVYQRDKGLCVTRANHHLSFFHTSSVHLYTHFNLSLCSVRHRSKFQTKCVCVCVFVRSAPVLILFNFLLDSFLPGSRSPALLYTHLLCSVFSISDIFF